MFDDVVSAPAKGSAILSAMPAGVLPVAMPAANDEPASPPPRPDDERSRVQAIADRLARGITGRHRTIPRADGWRVSASPDEPEGVFDERRKAPRAER